VRSLLVNGELAVDAGEWILDAASGRHVRRAVEARYKAATAR